MEAVIDTLLSRNAAYRTKHVARPPMPTLDTIVVSCMDARIDPAHVLGLELGEALVVRNAGGRVTEAVEQEVGAILAMAAKMTGRAMAPRVVLVHHTRCGVERLADPAVAAHVAEASGVPQAQIAHWSIGDHDHAASLRVDLERLRASAFLPKGIRVTGLRYDEETGVAEALFTDVTL